MLGMAYVIAVAVIWIIASFVVQSVVGAGVSPFLITYLCNSLFIVYLPVVEGGKALSQWLEEKKKRRGGESTEAAPVAEKEKEKETVHLLEEPNPKEELGVSEVKSREWSRREIAHVSLLICPFWFLAQFTFNLSLRYTTVTVNVFPKP